MSFDNSFPVAHDWFEPPGFSGIGDVGTPMCSSSQSAPLGSRQHVSVGDG